MNNDELKKKIMETLKNTVINYDCGHAIRAKNFYAERVFERFTDALIEAGIGDVKEVNCELTRIEVLKRERFAEEHGFTPDCTPYYIAEQYKHRAEVAERKGMTDEKVYSVDEVNHLISEMDKVIAKLKTENAALRERLEKSVELPVNIGDVKYLISSDKSCVLEEKVIAVQVTKYEYNVEVDEIDTKNQYGTIESFKIKQWNGDMFFKTREEAEARLAELKGEEK